MHQPTRPAGLVALALVLAACSTVASPSASSIESVPVTASASAAAGEPSATPSPGEPSASASGSEPTSDPVVVTFRVGGDEEYRILLTDPADIAVAQQLLAGEEAPRIPNGVVVRGDDGGVNTGYSWHIDPGSLEFADMTIEICDGLPSDVERGMISDRFCPWSAEVIAIEPAG
jgi:hypothetical protein